MGTTLDSKVRSGTRSGKPNYPVEFKRQLAIAASEPGVSVSKLALAHQVNANMVFKWRRDLRAGLLDIEPPGSATLLPVKFTRAPAPAAALAPIPPISHSTSVIEIAIAEAIVRVRGDIDATLLKTVIESLRA